MNVALRMPHDSKPLLGGATLPAGLDQPERFAARLAQALNHSHMIRVQGPAVSAKVLDRWSRAIAALGTPLFDGEDGATGVKNNSMWVDVRYDPERQHTFRHSCTAQPLHTDSAYNAVTTDITVFVCEEKAVSGGATLFVSAHTLAETAKAKDPRLYEELFDLPIPHGKAGVRGRTVPVLEQRKDGLYVNWNYYRVLKDESARVHDFAERLFRFLQNEIVDKNLATALQLEPGEAILFEDNRVLHGREAFTPSPRCLWKCAFKRRSA